MNFKNFDAVPGLIYGLSQSNDGPMNIRLGNFGIETSTKNNRIRFLKKKNLSPERTVFALSLRQAEVLPVDVKDAGVVKIKTDGLITNEKNLFLALTVADCVPVYLYDPNTKTLGLLHAGWQGIGAGIIEAGIEKFKKNFSSNPGDIFAGLGPCVQAHHYEIQDDLQQKFKDYEVCIQETNGKLYLDLPQVCAKKLSDLGLNSQHIEMSKICTFCQENTYFSYRRDKIKPPKVMLAYIGMSIKI